MSRAFPLIACAALSFAVGMWADRRWLRPAMPTPAVPAPSAKPAPSRAAPIPHATVNVRAAAPRSTSGEDADLDLLNLIQDAFPPARAQSSVPQRDGTTTTRERTDTGDTILRTFNREGALVGENWQRAGGDKVIRTYYDGGAIKGFNWERANGSTVVISFTQSGVFKGRSDRLADGTRIVTTYDDQGQPLEKWAITVDGKATRLSGG
jgi:hypothetical protein